MNRTAAAQTGNPDVFEGTFLFDPDDRIYAVHFPGNPVVPGSMIVGAFIRAAHEAGLASDACALHNFRFRKFIAPGEYAFRMEADGTVLTCSLFAGGTTVATGILKP